MIHWLIQKLGLKNCPECNTLVDFAMDGLQDGQRGAVRKHLNECPPCMEQVRDFLQVNEALGLSAPQLECPDGFEQKVLQRLKQESQGPPRVGTRAESLGAWPLFWLRLGPVFAALSLIMTFVAFGAIWRAGNQTSVVSSELAQASETLMKDPSAMHVALSSMTASPNHGELVLSRGNKNIYLKADRLVACRKGASYVLWMQVEGQAPMHRLASFMVEAEGTHFQLLQLPQAIDAKGPVKFMLTQDDWGSPKVARSEAWLAGTVTL